MSATVRILLKRRAELHDGMQDSYNIDEVKSSALALHCGVSNDGLGCKLPEQYECGGRKPLGCVAGKRCKSMLLYSIEDRIVAVESSLQNRITAESP